MYDDQPKRIALPYENDKYHGHALADTLLELGLSNLQRATRPAARSFSCQKMPLRWVLIELKKKSTPQRSTLFLLFFLRATQIVHGGITALTFDNLLGWALFLQGTGAVFTASLKVN